MLFSEDVLWNQGIFWMCNVGSPWCGLQISLFRSVAEAKKIARLNRTWLDYHDGWKWQHGNNGGRSFSNLWGENANVAQASVMPGPCTMMSKYLTAERTFPSRDWSSQVNQFQTIFKSWVSRGQYKFENLEDVQSLLLHLSRCCVFPEMLKRRIFSPAEDDEFSQRHAS